MGPFITSKLYQMQEDLSRSTDMGSYYLTVLERKVEGSEGAAANGGFVQNQAETMVC